MCEPSSCWGKPLPCCPSRCIQITEIVWITWILSGYNPLHNCPTNNYLFISDGWDQYEILRRQQSSKFRSDSCRYSHDEKLEKLYVVNFWSVEAVLTPGSSLLISYVRIVLSPSPFATTRSWKGEEDSIESDVMILPGCFKVPVCHLTRKNHSSKY